MVRPARWGPPVQNRRAGAGADRTRLSPASLVDLHGWRSALYPKRFNHHDASGDMTDATTAEAKAGESHQFQAEVAELLRLMVHSVYSETDVFLRELISNASDACDRLRYEAIANSDLLVEDPELKIRLIPDKDAGALTIADNGIGMDRQQLIDNHG